MNNRVSVLVVVPHKGRLDYLVSTVNSLFVQEAEGFNVKIVVITQDDQKTVKQALEFATNYVSEELLVIQRPTAITISELRNTGAVSESTEYLGFVDADVVMDTNWIQYSHHAITKSGYMIIGVCQKLPANPTSIHSIKCELSKLNANRSVQSLPGANLFMSFKTFELLGGFPEQLSTCEDYYLTNKAAQIGTIYSTSDTSYIHLGEDQNLTEVFRKEQWRASSNFASLLGRSVRVSEIPSLIVPIVILSGAILIVLSLLLSSKLLSFFSLLLVSPIFIYSVVFHRRTNKRLELVNIAKFFTVYFIARAIGMLKQTVYVVVNGIRNLLL